MKFHFFSRIITIKGISVVRIPREVSDLLPSRGLVLAQVTATLNEQSESDSIVAILALEPDGEGSHWFEWPSLAEGLPSAEFKEPFQILVDTDIQWFEPDIPSDFLQALNNQQLFDVWTTITVKAKWEWIRWIRSTSNITTRMGRIEAACDKLKKGLKRPCCFDQSRCSIPELSAGGKLISD